MICQDLKDRVDAIINSEEYLDKIAKRVLALNSAPRRNDFQQREGNIHKRDHHQYSSKGKGRGKSGAPKRTSGPSYTRSRYTKSAGDKRSWSSRGTNGVTLRQAASRHRRWSGKGGIKPRSNETHDYRK